MDDHDQSQEVKSNEELEMDLKLELPELSGFLQQENCVHFRETLKTSSHLMNEFNQFLWNRCGLNLKVVPSNCWSL